MSSTWVTRSGAILSTVWTKPDADWLVHTVDKTLLVIARPLLRHLSGSIPGA